MKTQLLLFLTLILSYNSIAQVAYSNKIRLNQVGFYPGCQKLGVAKDAPAGLFYITLVDNSDTLFTGTLTAAANWTYSNENVRVADFSAFKTLGNYVLLVPTLGRSFPFSIDPYVHKAVNMASIKAFYFNRHSQAITAAYGGVYARALGHPDNNVIVLPSAASAARPAGTILSQPKGWYDAGDYNKYIVNSGISTYTLLAAYEHFPGYYNSLDLNIPESGNALPDILDEIKWNLDWMLTMQDPADGGVYNKTTNANFDGVIMPAAATAARYLCAKGTAATFDFTAVMATAARVYMPYDPTFAAQCQAAAIAAYTWGIANPTVAFNNPGAQGGYPAVVTGGYGDGNFGDEREWAANELYITTSNDAYYTANGFRNANNYIVPSWPNVRSLGLISLVYHRKDLTALALADTTNMKNKIFALANGLTTGTAASAYRVPMGTAAGDWVWGSNGHASNQGMILIQAYMLNKDLIYWNAAVSAIDYLLGRNPTTFSFVTGHGDNPPMNIHHRPSAADGILNPVPGFLAGGPNLAAQTDCGEVTYPSTTLRALAYQDAFCSYSTNEIAINWNAPFAYLSGALEALNPCNLATLPVDWISFQAEEINEEVLLNWQTTNESNNSHYIVQRSVNGNDFENITKIKAGTPGNQINNYVSTDQNPNKGVAYYRIAQIDLDGKFSFTHVISINIEPTTTSIFPNPAKDYFEVKVGFGLGDYLLSIRDFTGKLIFSENVSSGENLSKVISTGAWTKGIYILQLTNSDISETHKVVIQ